MTHRNSPAAAPEKKSAELADKTKLHYRNMLDEADIGSGEKTPGQEDTEKFVRAVPLNKNDTAHGAAQDTAAEALDPEAEQVGTAHSLVDQMAEDESLAELAFGEEDDVALDKTAHDSRISIDQDEPDSLLDDLDPVPPKGN